MADKWITVAEGTSLDDLHSTGIVDKIPHNMEFDVIVTPRFGWLAPVADLAGSEWVAEQFLGTGAKVIDVEGKDGLVYIHCRANAVQIIPLLAVIAAVLAAIALLIIAIRVDAPEEVIEEVTSEIKWILIGLAVLAAIVLIGFLAYRGFLPKPKGGAG